MATARTGGRRELVKCGTILRHSLQKERRISTEGQRFQQSPAAGGSFSAITKFSVLLGCGARDFTLGGSAARWRGRSTPTPSGAGTRAATSQRLEEPLSDIGNRR
jgi:hypothetical protein